MGARFGLVAFDLYGTLLDIGRLAERLTDFVGKRAETLLGEWRKAQIDRTWELNRRAQYETFDQVTAVALEQVAPDLSQEARKQMCDLWLTLPAYPDAVEAVRALRSGRVRTAVLSNGTAAMVRSALNAGGLALLEVRSVDEVRAYKPDPRIYALLDAIAPRDRTLFISANGWDADGCKRTGRTVAFIDRGAPAPTLAVDLRVRSLREVARAALQPA